MSNKCRLQASFVDDRRQGPDLEVESVGETQRTARTHVTGDLDQDPAAQLQVLGTPLQLADGVQDVFEGMDKGDQLEGADDGRLAGNGDDLLALVVSPVRLDPNLMSSHHAA